jgi:hypothetical protein
MGLSKCFLEGPKNGTSGMLGEPNGRMWLGPRGRRASQVPVERR